MSMLRWSRSRWALVVALLADVSIGGGRIPLVPSGPSFAAAVAAQESVTTEWLAMDGVIGTAVGLDSGGDYVVNFSADADVIFASDFERLEPLGSLASIRPGGGSPAYAAQKMGMVGLTRSAAHSYAKDNIRSLIISPGHVDTPVIRGNNPHSPNDWSTSIDNPENFQRRLGNTPLGRLQTPEDIANAFLFAATDEAAMITGSLITVDGGAGM